MSDQSLYLVSTCVLGSTEQLRHEFTRRFADHIVIPPTRVYMTGTKGLRFNGQHVGVFLAIEQEGVPERLRRNVYRNAISAIITFDKRQRESFHAVRDYYTEFCEFHPADPIALMGFFPESTVVTSEEAQNLGDELGMTYYETNPNDDTTITNVFHDFLKKVLKTRGILGESFSTPEPPSAQAIQKMQQAKKEVIRKLIFEDQLATRIDITLPADVSPEDLAMHKELALEYQDPRITIRQKRDKDNVEEQGKIQE